MKKRKENMAPDYRKSGYVKIGRSVLRAFFEGEREMREMAEILLCVETFAYFSEGQVCLNKQIYFCHPGEWITSYSEMEELTRIDRRQVKKCLVKLEQLHFVIVTNVDFYRRIALVNYEQSLLVQHGDARVGTGHPNDPGSMDNASLWDQASDLYTNQNRQKGAVN